MKHEEIVKDLYSKKLNQKEIALQLGISRQRVQQIETKLGISRSDNMTVDTWCKGCGKPAKIPQSIYKKLKENYCCSQECYKLVRLQKHLTFIDSVKKECHICKKTSSRYSTYSGSRLICRKCNTERIKKYRNTLVGREATRKASTKSLEKHKEKQDARILVATHLRKGTLTKPECCSRCSKTKKLEGHHYDYSKPLDVIWICRQCHADIHRLTDR